MDEIRNPFAPGAGSSPPALVGRERIIENARIALQRAKLGKHANSCIFKGLRGTGKTVLLNEIGKLTGQQQCQLARIEAPVDRRLAQLLYPELHGVLRRLSKIEQAKAMAIAAKRALSSFAKSFKLSIADLSLEVDPEPGVADSGNLERDLIDLMTSVGKAAQAAQTACVLIIDEIQYLDKKELGALASSLHRGVQAGLPLLLFGAGLPQITSLLGEAKTYSERLFLFETIDSLDHASSLLAISLPIEQENESISDAALELICQKTSGYPYFLQEWGYQSWNIAECSPIRPKHVKIASINALKRLDDSFFSVRFDRLTNKERQYVLAMAALGDGPYRTPDIAGKLGEKIQAVAPRRASIIKKGIAYSPKHGDIEFTVPMFTGFLQRQYPQSG